MQEAHADTTPMLVFFVEGMVGNRLAGAVSRAICAFDIGAKIRTDPLTQRLDVEPRLADAQEIVDILRVAGFRATLTASEPGSVFSWADWRSSAATDSDPQRPGAAGALVDFDLSCADDPAVDGFADAPEATDLFPPSSVGAAEPP